jgi:hypothetical protein
VHRVAEIVYIPVDVGRIPARQEGPGDRVLAEPKAARRHRDDVTSARDCARADLRALPAVPSTASRPRRPSGYTSGLNRRPAPLRGRWHLSLKVCSGTRGFRCGRVPSCGLQIPARH